MIGYVAIMFLMDFQPWDKWDTNVPILDNLTNTNDVGEYLAERFNEGTRAMQTGMASVSVPPGSTNGFNVTSRQGIDGHPDPATLGRPKVYVPMKTTSVKRQSAKHNSKINILFWTKYYGRVFHSHNLFESCPFSQCTIITDRSAYNTSDAVIFHLWKNDLNKNIPGYRLENQHWFVFSREPPTRLSALVTEEIRWTFNMTIGYSKTSDVFTPYGRTVGFRQVQKMPKWDFTRGRTKMIAWVVSHCWGSSGRFQFVRELQKFVAVDVFGKCGKPCPGDQGGKRSIGCLDTIGKYLSFMSFQNERSFQNVTFYALTD
jgi:hypothetical protein